MTTTSPDAMREAFEKWYDDTYVVVAHADTLKRETDGTYRWPHVRDSWTAYQAAWSARTPAQSETIEALKAKYANQVNVTGDGWLMNWIGPAIDRTVAICQADHSAAVSDAPDLEGLFAAFQHDSGIELKGIHAAMFRAVLQRAHALGQPKPSPEEEEFGGLGTIRADLESILAQERIAAREGAIRLCIKTITECVSDVEFEEHRIDRLTDALIALLRDTPEAEQGDAK